MFLKKGLVFFAFLPWFIPSDMLKNKEDELSQFFLAFAGLSGTLLGFVISSMSILMALRGHKTVNNLAKTGHYSNLLEILFWTGMLFFLSMLCAIVSFFWSNVYVWKFNFTLFVGSAILLMIAGTRFWKIISIIKPDEGNPHTLD